MSQKLLIRGVKKFQDEAIKKGKETGVCYQAPEDGPAVSRKDRERLDPDHAACNALFEEAGQNVMLYLLPVLMIGNN